MGKPPHEGGGRDGGKADKSRKPVEQPRRAPAVKVATPKARDAAPFKQAGRPRENGQRQGKRDIRGPLGDGPAAAMARDRDAGQAGRRDIREKPHNESSSKSRGDKGLVESRAAGDKRELDNVVHQRDIRARQLAQLDREIEPLALKEVEAGEKTDDELSADIVQSQLTILEMWKSSLEHFDKVMTSAPEDGNKEPQPEFKNGIKDFLQKKVIGELNGVLGKVMARPALPGVGDALSLLESLETEVSRAMEASKSATLREFVVEFGRAFNRLEKPLGLTKSDFTAAVRMKREAMEAAEAVKTAEVDNTGPPRTTLTSTPEAGEYGLLRARHVETVDRLNAIANKTTPENLFRILSEEWLNRSVTRGPMGYNYPAEVEIFLRSDYSVIRARIHAPGGKEIAQQLRRDSPEGVDVFGLKVRRKIVVLGNNGMASSVLRLDADGRVLNEGTFAENGGHALQPLLSGRGLQRTKELE